MMRFRLWGCSWRSVWFAVGHEITPVHSQNSCVRTASDRADHRSSRAPRTYTVTESC
jgi:hypothetical protein